MARSKKETNLEIPGAWRLRDRHLFKLAAQTGFQSVNRLVAFVCFEVSRCKTPAKFYRALSSFHEEATRKPSRR